MGRAGSPLPAAALMHCLRPALRSGTSCKQCIPNYVAKLVNSYRAEDADASSGSIRASGIHDVFGQLIQKLVCLRFLVQSLLKELRGFVLSKQLRKCVHTAVAGDLVMLDLLRSHNDRGVEHGILAHLP